MSLTQAEAKRIGGRLFALPGNTLDKTGVLIDRLQECKTQDQAIAGVNGYLKSGSRFCPTVAEFEPFLVAGPVPDQVTSSQRANARCVKCFGEGWERVAAFRNGQAYEAVQKCSCAELAPPCDWCNAGVREHGEMANGRKGLCFCLCVLGKAKYCRDQMVIANGFSGKSNLPLEIDVQAQI